MLWVQARVAGMVLEIYNKSGDFDLSDKSRSRKLEELKSNDFQGLLNQDNSQSSVKLAKQLQVDHTQCYDIYMQWEKYRRKESESQCLSSGGCCNAENNDETWVKSFTTSGVFSRHYLLIMHLFRLLQYIFSSYFRNIEDIQKCIKFHRLNSKEFFRFFSSIIQ